MKKLLVILVAVLLLAASACAKEGNEVGNLPSGDELALGTNGVTNMAEEVEIALVGSEPHGQIDLELTEETAVVIADAIFLQLFGKEFLEDTVVFVKESVDGNSLSVCRYQELVAGGDHTIVIRRSDAKVIRMEFGE